MQKDTLERLSLTSVILHWIVALTIIGLMAVGKYMEENEVYSLYGIHKSTGTLIFAFVVYRVIWRMMNGWPEPVSRYKAWEVTLAKIAHWVLIIGTVLFPVSGFMMSGLGGHGIPLFGIELLGANEVGGKTVPINADMAKLGREIHGILFPVMLVAILLHATGALKHHLTDKDNTLRRMLGMGPR